jgi:hypothetical protein
MQVRIRHPQVVVNPIPAGCAAFFNSAHTPDLSVAQALIRTGSNVESSVKARYSLKTRFENQQKRGNRKRPRSIEVGMSFKRHRGKLVEVEPIFDCSSTFRTPNLFAYSASRHMAVRNFDNSELRDPAFNLLSESAKLYDAEQVLISLDDKG